MDNKRDNPLTFQPCGIDDLREEDVAEFLDPLPGLASALREEEKEQGGAGAKEEQETLAAVYQDEPAALNTLKVRLAGDAPWLKGSIPYPLVTLQKPYSPRGVYFDYEPKMFYFSERTYEDWLEIDSTQHLFHWRQETSEVCSVASPFLYTQTWYCHCAGKPEIKKKAEGKKRRQVFKSSKHMGCLARVYVHKFKDDHPPAPGYPVINSSKRVRLTYYGRHTGHVLGELEGFQHLRISKPLREEILSYIKLGLGKRAIKDKLTLHSDVLYSRLSEGTLSRDNFVTLVDIANDAYWRERSQERSDCVSRTADTTALAFKEENIERDEITKEEHEQNRMHDSVRALVESFSRSSRDALMNEETIRLVKQLVDHACCLPGKKDNSKQRPKQKY